MNINEDIQEELQKEDNLTQNLSVVINTLKIVLQQETDTNNQSRLEECIRLLEKWI